MSEWLSLPEFLKLSPRHLLPVALVAGVMTLSDDRRLEQMGLKGFRDQYRPWIAVVFLGSAAVVVSHVVCDGAGMIRRQHERREARKEGRRRLHDLTPREKQILGGYIYGQTRTQRFSLGNGVAQGLVESGILYIPTNVGSPDAWAYNIEPWAWRYLHRHAKELLGSPEELASNPLEHYLTTRWGRRD